MISLEHLVLLLKLPENGQRVLKGQRWDLKLSERPKVATLSYKINNSITKKTNIVELTLHKISNCTHHPCG